MTPEAPRILLVSADDGDSILPPDHGLNSVIRVAPEAVPACIGELQSRRTPAVVVVDSAVPQMTTLLAEFALKYPEVPVVVAARTDAPLLPAPARCVRRPRRSGALVSAVRDAARSAGQQMRVRTTLDQLNVRLRAGASDADERQQRRLLVSGLYLQNILEQASDAVFVTDRQGVLTLWNQAAERVFGVAARNVLGRRIDTIAIAATREGSLLDYITRLRPDGPLYRGAFTCRTEAGERELDVSLSLVLDADGSAIAVSGIARDITERNALYSELARKADELAASNRHKEEFLAVLSHELRTPLNTAMGWAQILECTPHDAERVQRGMAVIRRNTQLQLRLVLDLLDYAGISAGKLFLQCEPCDLAAITETIVGATRPQLDALQLELVEEYGAHAIAMVDPERMAQVVSNLLGNAMKFTAPGERLQVRVGRSGDDVELAVSDTGRGIAPEFLPYVFEAFRQADVSTNRAGHGLGLGLAIAQRIVELHGGRISVHSAGIGHGATFTMRLPAVTQTAIE